MKEFSWVSEANPVAEHSLSVEEMKPVKQHSAIIATVLFVGILLSCALVNGILGVCFGCN